MTDYERGRQDERAAVVGWLDSLAAAAAASFDPNRRHRLEALCDAAFSVMKREHLPPNGTNLAPETTESR